MVGGRHGLIAALDVGTTKTCCFIARNGAEGLRTVGIGHQVSKGLRSGAVTDMDQVEESIRAAVDQAERMAGETVRDVFVNLSCGDPNSHIVGVECAIAGYEVSEQDYRRVLDQGQPEVDTDREVIHRLPIGFSIDGNGGIRDPRGMYGERLGVNLHVITAAPGPLRNLSLCVRRGHLDLAGVVVSPYASGLACLVPDELDLGATLVDMGGGSTTIAVFHDGNLIHTATIPIGGAHVTNDIARGLSTPTSHAERLKTLYGSAIPSPSDDSEMIDVPQVGEDEQESAHHIPRSILNGIIRPRVEETLEMVRGRLEASGIERVAGRRVVLTGGSSQVQGVRDLAARILDKQVRVGRPIGIKGLADATCGPAFSTCAGLLAFGAEAEERAYAKREPANENFSGRFARIGKWLRESF